MEENKKLYLAAVGKLMDRDYQFLPLEEIEKINEGLTYKDTLEACTDEECEKNAIIISALPIKGRHTEILVARKHKSLKHMELNVPIYVAQTKSNENGSITKVLSDAESLASLNNDKEKLIGTTMLEIPEGISIFSAQLLFSYVMAKATIDVEKATIQLDDELQTEINTGDTMYSLTHKLISLL